MTELTDISRDFFGSEPLVIIDGHADVPNPLETGSFTHTIDRGTAVDLDLLRAGGVGAVVLAANAVPGEGGGGGAAGDLAIIQAKIAAIRAICVSHADKAGLALKSTDLSRIAGEGRTAIVLELLGTHALGGDLAAIERFYRDGVRILGLAHIGNTAFADSSRPLASQRPGENGGLSPLGREAVKLANTLGLLLNVSQLSTQALLHTVEQSRAPVIASHSGVRNIVDDPRNLLDAELDAVAEKGGVVGIVAFGAYLRNLTPAETAARTSIAQSYGGMKEGYASLTRDERQAYYRAIQAVTQPASLEDYLRSVDYAVNRIGIDHVSLSSDFNQGGGVEGWARADEAPQVTRALIERGYAADDIRKLWGGNILRVLRAAEETAHGISLSPPLATA